MADPLMVEGQVLYHSIENIDDPKEALEKLATLEAPMGWVNIERSRAIAYGMWLKDNDMDDWYAYYEKLLQFFAQISAGGTVDFESFANVEAPEEWVVPTPYLKGLKKNTGHQTSD